MGPETVPMSLQGFYEASVLSGVFHVKHALRGRKSDAGSIQNHRVLIPMGVSPALPGRQ